VSRFNREVSNSDDVIDSRDVIKRIEDLEGEHSNCDGDPDNCPLDDEERAELEALKALESQCEHYCNWRHGATLIRDSYFTTYARESTEDIAGEIPSWVVVDWDATAEGMQIDYTSVEFDGVTYWVRS
jgi:hypothetical protein